MNKDKGVSVSASRWENQIKIFIKTNPGSSRDWNVNLINIHLKFKFSYSFKITSI